MNPSNRKDVSIGPPAASGWNCTDDHGLVWWMTPSFVLSFAFVNKVFQPSGRVAGSTANLKWEFHRKMASQQGGKSEWDEEDGNGSEQANDAVRRKYWKNTEP